MSGVHELKAHALFNSQECRNSDAYRAPNEVLMTRLLVYSVADANLYVQLVRGR